METSGTGLLKRTLSSVFPNSRTLGLIEMLVIFLLGVAAIALHAKLRIPLHLPGRQGVLFLAIIFFTRLSSKMPYAASLSMLGAASSIWIFGMGFHDPFMPFYYLVIGIFIDLTFRVKENINVAFWYSGFIAGLGWMMIPLFRLAIGAFTGLPFDSFRSGMIYPIATHLLFGVMGGLLGYSIFKISSGRRF
jgi:hypothetical protein